MAFGRGNPFVFAVFTNSQVGGNTRGTNGAVAVVLAFPVVGIPTGIDHGKHIARSNYQAKSTSIAVWIWATHLPDACAFTTN